MNEQFDSTDRTPLELFLFALAFAALLMAVAGITLAVPVLALFGGALFVLSLLGYWCGSSVGD
jgi:hypothetical protein